MSPTEYLRDMKCVDGILRDLKHYNARKRIREELSVILQRIPTLEPLSGKYVSRLGEKMTLLYVKGTIPVNYKGHMYQVLIEIWLPSAYPHVPPKSFVKTAPGIAIKPNHTYVDAYGKFSHSYLESWKAQTHCLLELLDIERSVFSERCPIHRKETGSSSGSTSNESHTQLLVSIGSRQSMTSQSSEPARNRDEALRSKNHRRNSEATRPRRTKSPPQPPPQWARRRDAQLNDAAVSSNDAMKKKMAHESLVQQLTEQIQEELKEIQDKAETEKEDERCRHGFLDRVKLKTEQQVHEMDEMLNNIQMETIHKTAWMSSHQMIIDLATVDELIVPKDEPSKEIFKDYANVHAIDDLLYQLDKALASKAIPLDVFLKEVRTYSALQFKYKCLINNVSKENLKHHKFTHVPLGYDPPSLAPRKSDPVQSTWI